MFKKLFQSLFGEFPPKNLPLCDKCRTAYTVVGIIKPPVSFDELVEVLYSYNLLCDNPCGSFSKMPAGSTVLRKGPANIGTTLQSMLDKYGFCRKCNVSTATLLAIGQSDLEFANALPAMHDKSILCTECMAKFKHSYKDYQAELEQITIEKVENL